MAQKKLWSKEFTAMIVSTLFMSWAFYALLPTLPIYLIKDLRIDHRSLAIIMAAFSVSAILARPISGHLLDNYRRAHIMIISLAVMTVLYGIYPLVGTGLAMLVLRLAHGALWGLSTSSSAPVVADIVPPSRLGEGIGIFATCIPIGTTVGPLFGLYLLNSRGPLVMFVAILGISFLSLASGFFTRTASKPLPKKKFSSSNLFHKKAFPISLCMFFVTCGYGAVIVFAGVYAAQRSFPNAAAYFLCFAAAIFLSRMCSGRLFDRGRFVLLIVAGHFLTAVGMLWIGYAANPVQFLLAGMVSGFGFGTLMPTSQAAINVLVGPDERGAANSTYMTSYDLGVGVASLAVSLLLSRVSLGQIYRYGALLILLSWGIFLLRAIPHFHRNKVDVPAIS